MYRSVYISAQRYIHNLCIDNVASYTNVKEQLVHILIPLPHEEVTLSVPVAQHVVSKAMTFRTIKRLKR